MSLKYMVVPATNFKMDVKTGLFTAYANTKNFIDHVKDRAVDGCYLNSISKHKVAKTMPKMFWSHNPYELPVGAWKSMDEDAKGLLMSGKLSKTTMGKDIEILADDGALDSFSIGYQTIKEKWNNLKDCNDLKNVLKLHRSELPHTLSSGWETRALSKRGWPTQRESTDGVVLSKAILQLFYSLVQINPLKLLQRRPSAS